MSPSSVVSPPVRPSAPALPWVALLTLGAATTVMVTAEMLPTAVLEPMSVGLGVGESRIGHLVGLWALTVVIASIPLVRLTARHRRRRLIVLGLLALAVSAAGTALAPGYGLALIARLVGATAVGVLWATANAHVAALVPEELLGRAVAVVLGGATLGMVIGTPFGRLLAEQIGWRAPFWVLAGAALAAAAAVRSRVPDLPRRPPDRAAGEHPAATSIAPIVRTVVLVAVVLAGHYGAYTFVTRLTAGTGDALPGGMSVVLLVFGLASAAGVAAAGRVTRPRALVAAAVVTAVSVAALTGADQRWLDPWWGLAVVIVWGAASGALPPLAQTGILRAAGTEHRDLAAALIPVVFNGGIAIGATLAAGLVGTGGIGVLPLVAALVVAAGTLGLARAG